VKPAEIIFSNRAKQALSSLRTDDADKRATSLLRGIERVLEVLAQDPFYGNPVSRKLLPNVLYREYGLIALFRIELPSFWRMLYTVRDAEGKIVVTILIIDILDHPAYDRLFGYKKS